jgi:hypothetical protein
MTITTNINKYVMTEGEIFFNMDSPDRIIA